MEPEFVRVRSFPPDMLNEKVSHVTAPSSDLLVFERSSSNDCNLHNKTHKNLEIHMRLDTEKYS
jgi:hypothetical protein